MITNQESLLNILREFYLCWEPKPNKAKLWVGKKTNLFVEKNLFPEVPWSFDKLYVDSRLVRKIRDGQNKVRKLQAGERKQVWAKHIETNLNFTRTKENDGLDRIKLKVEGEAGDYFFNSHHRRKYAERLASLGKGEEVNLVLLGGKNLVFVDRVVF